MKRQGGILAWAAALLIAVSALMVAGAACSRPAAMTYAPAAYGAAGHCYYVDDPAEAQALIASGACPSSWTPAPMPAAWHQTYFAYYSSPAYVNSYVPAPERTVYATQSKAYGARYAVQISASAKTATWQSNTGKKVTGPVGTAKFGAGSARAPSYGGGAARAPGPATAPVGTAKFGAGSARAPSYGGGAGRAPAPAPARPAPAAPRSGFGGGARGGR